MFKGFITNLGLHNEGYCVLDIGEWIEFPIAEEEIAKVFERIHICDEYEEYYFTDWESDNNFDPHEYFGEYANIEHVNEIAETLEEYFDEDEQKMNAILEVQERNDVIDMLDGGFYRRKLDNYMLYPGVNDDYELGLYIVQEFDYKLANLLEDNNLKNYFDYEAYGRDNSFNGSYTSEGFLEYIG